MKYCHQKQRHYGINIFVRTVYRNSGCHGETPVGFTPAPARLNSLAQTPAY